jgi:pyridoxal phosphate enzyme (YggS family)
MSFPRLAANLAHVRAEVERLQAAAGLAGGVTIVAVTKGFGPEAAAEAFAAGLPDVGENRVQEALAKMEPLAGTALRWHLIGHLQTNKAKRVPERFAMVHSVDSERVVAALADAAGRVPRAEPLPVLLQVNVAGEAQKSGCAPDAVEALAERALAADGLVLKGLMTMAPFTDDERVQRRAFAGLREIRERLAARGIAAPELSMGMSGDYPAAVREGATILRLGTVLFGERPT